MLKTSIIGSGIAGLAAAIRMARLGHEVDVFEKSSMPGGKIGEIVQEGFRFDMGPSLFTLPNLVGELLDNDLQIDYRRLEVITRYFFEDGTRINAYSDPWKFAHVLHKKMDIDPIRILDYLNEAAKIYEITAPVFLFNPVHRLKDILTFSNLKRFLQLYKVHPFKTLHQLNSKRFKDERIIQLFDRYATYNGSSPYETPGTLQVISHLEHNLGAYFPGQGMRAIVDALVEQAKRLNVNFHFNAEVKTVDVENGRARGLFLNGHLVESDIVISDVDVYHFYSKILPDPKKLKKLKKAERSSSALIFYWGMDKEFPELDLHNVFFSNNYRKEFDSLFEKKILYADPTIYLFISSKENKSDAPYGMENWFVMINVPENVGQEWGKQIKKIRKKIVAKLNRLLGENIEPHILFEQILDPVKIEQNTSSFRGALYGPSSNSRFSAFNRHPNFHRKIKGLYFVGGSVHPGGGIPLCLSSAKIVEKLIKENERNSIK